MSGILSGIVSDNWVQGRRTVPDWSWRPAVSATGRAHGTRNGNKESEPTGYSKDWDLQAKLQMSACGSSYGIWICADLQLPIPSEGSRGFHVTVSSSVLQHLRAEQLTAVFFEQALQIKVGKSQKVRFGCESVWYRSSGKIWYISARRIWRPSCFLLFCR